MVQSSSSRVLESDSDVERWLTSPVKSGSTRPRAQHSDPEISLSASLKVRSSQVVNSNSSSRSQSSPPSKTSTLTRGKRLLRQRMKEKERKEKQISKDLEPSSPCSSLDISREAEKAKSSFQKTINTSEVIDLKSVVSGSSTPSTAASTRSPSSTIQNSFSALGSESFSPSSSDSREGALRGKRSIDVETDDQKVIESTLLSKTSSAKRTLQRNLQAPPPPPPPPPPPRSSPNKISRSSFLPITSSIKSPKKIQEVEQREETDSRIPSTRVSGERQHAILPGHTNRIKLHVYDLIADETVVQLPWGCHFPIGKFFKGLNSTLHSLGTGAYHVGIEINGVEYAYGANSTRGMTGVFSCAPKHSPGYQFRSTIDLGDHACIRMGKFFDGRQILREMASDYLGPDYDILRKNCVTFAHDAALRLGVHERDIPEWFRNLCVAGAAAQDKIAPITNAFSACELDGLNQIVDTEPIDDR